MIGQTLFEYIRTGKFCRRLKWQLSSFGQMCSGIYVIFTLSGLIAAVFAACSGPSEPLAGEKSPDFLTY
jgi:hypothetical protein